MAGSGGKGEDRLAATGGRWSQPRSEPPPRFDDGDTDPQTLTATFWFDPGPSRHPSSATIKFAGHRVGVTGLPSPRDRFVQEETIEGVVPGSGPVSITARVRGVNPGEWAVTAEMVGPPRRARDRRSSRRPGQLSVQVLRPAAWSWRRWALSTSLAGPVKTRWAPLAVFERMPAVVPGSYTVLVTLGVVIGLMVQARLLALEHLDAGRALMASLVAVAVGLVGAKLWYLALDRQLWRESLTDGWCIQGFLAGSAVTAIAAMVVLHLPVGRVLDATSPGLFIGLAVGKLGCFLTGCCAGRPTGSRWGVWSSDRRVGARRFPAQLLESATALIVGVAALLLVLHFRPAVPGAWFIASFATYTLCRQFLLRLRAERRRSRIGGPITAAGSALILAADMMVTLLGSR